MIMIYLAYQKMTGKYGLARSKLLSFQSSVMIVLATLIAIITGLVMKIEDVNA